MNFGSRLKQWRRKNKLNQEKACAVIGIKFRTYQNYELNLSPPGFEALKQMLDAGININWLISGLGDMSLTPHNHIAEQANLYESNSKQNEFALIPFYDIEASAGHGSLIDNEQPVSDMAFRKDWLKSKGLLADKCALIKCRGDSMEPTISDGDLLLIDTRVDSIQDDTIYIIQTDSHLIVKRIQQGLDGSITIISDNKRYRDQIINPDMLKEVNIVGVLAWYGHELKHR